MREGICGNTDLYQPLLNADPEIISQSLRGIIRQWVEQDFMGEMTLRASGSMKYEEEIKHFSHPQHPLYLASQPYLFTCAGCKEFGAGVRYRCLECEYHMHDFCAKAPASMNHPFHTQHQLIFYSKPGNTGLMKSSKCDVCGKGFKGFVFRCSVCSFSIHPSCGKLPMELVKCKQHPDHSLKLLSGSPDGNPYTCKACGKKGQSWVYYCGDCNLYLDVRCAKPAINGMQANNIAMPVKPTKLERAARFASQVVQLFVDGLVEGLGEGLADVLLDNIAKGGIGLNQHM